MRQLVTIVRVAAVALFCSALPYAVQAQLAGTYDEILKEAKAEGELHFMASGETFGGQEAMTLLEKAFNEKYGTNITLRFTPGPSMPAMAARLQQEAKSGAAASTGDGPGYTAFWQRRGAPLDFVVGIQPAPTDYFQVAVPKNSAHPNAAALFAAFLTTPEAQEIIDSVSFQGSRLSPNTTVAKYIKESGVKLLDPNELAQFFQSAEYRDIYGEMKQIFKN